MAPTKPQSVTFILRFSHGSGVRWTGAIEEVETGVTRHFICLETFVEELAQYGIALQHLKPDVQICATCFRLGGHSKAEI